MLSPDHIKRSVGKREAGRIPLLKGNLGVKAESPGEISRYPSKISIHIDSGDAAAKFFREIPRRTTEATADIENVTVCFKPEIPGKVDGGLAATDMELINGSKIIE